MRKCIHRGARARALVFLSLPACGFARSRAGRKEFRNAHTREREAGKGSAHARTDAEPMALLGGPGGGIFEREERRFECFGGISCARRTADQMFLFSGGAWGVKDDVTWMTCLLIFIVFNCSLICLMVGK